MAIFSNLYDKVLSWAKHRHAIYYLAFIAFIEAIFFPIPPDVMLVSMGLAKPERTWVYAGVTAFFSVVGGIVGYFIGVLCIDIVYPYILSWGYESTYHIVQNWFHVWGSWTIICTSFMPIPFKIITISAGAVSMPFSSFMLAAIVGRSLRFFLVSGFMFLYGEKLSLILRRYIDRIGLAVITVPVVVYIGYELITA
jgi:membrane protein YqaA with SNARE-associated domain